VSLAVEIADRLAVKLREYAKHGDPYILTRRIIGWIYEELAGTTNPHKVIDPALAVLEERKQLRRLSPEEVELHKRSHERVFIGYHETPDELHGLPAGTKEIVRVPCYVPPSGVCEILLEQCEDDRPDDSTRRWSQKQEELVETDAVAEGGTKEQRTPWWAKAILLVKDHPEWSDAKIAEAVGKSKSTLSRNKIYRAAAKLARDKGGPTKGFITTDADSGLKDIEAIAPTPHDVQNQSDAGQPIPGSKYLREYCAECGEPIKVRPDSVGKNPRCQGCQED
jgi:hypothetical protein